MVFRNVIASLVIILALSTGGTDVARADESVSMSVSFSTTDVGEFSVTMHPADASDPAFGTVALDADLDKLVTKSFVLEYTDTLAARGPGYVTLSISSFEPVTPVPPFPGSELAYFQIPNRYLVLTDVGDVVMGSGSTCTVGPITSSTSEEGLTFDVETPRRVADIAAGCGSGTASQAIDLTLTVPAGVYPTTYSATVTIETTFE